MKYLLYYLLFINTLSFLFYGIDKYQYQKFSIESSVKQQEEYLKLIDNIKYKSIHKKWRIKESILLLFSFLMGSFGSIFAMYLFHHKTKHLKFVIINFLTSLLWLFIIIKITKVI